MDVESGTNIRIRTRPYDDRRPANQLQYRTNRTNGRSPVSFDHTPTIHNLLNPCGGSSRDRTSGKTFLIYFHCDSPTTCETTVRSALYLLKRRLRGTRALVNRVYLYQLLLLFIIILLYVDLKSNKNYFIRVIFYRLRVQLMYNIIQYVQLCTL